MRLHALLFTVAISFMALTATPNLKALSFSPAKDLNETLGQIVQLTEFEGDQNGGFVWLSVPELGWVYFLPNRDASGESGSWFYLSGSWFYSERPDSPYFYMEEINGWTYHVPGTSLFGDVETGVWYDLGESVTSVDDDIKPIPVDGGDGTGAGAESLDDLLSE